MSEGEKECKVCHKCYPATFEFFRKKSSYKPVKELSDTCKTCAKAYHKQKETERRERDKKRAVSQAKWGLCLKCQRTPVDRKKQWICNDCNQRNGKVYGEMAEGQ